LSQTFDTDLPLALNGRDEFYVPGTSITGVLRSWCESNLQSLLLPDRITFVDYLFGPKRRTNRQLLPHQEIQHPGHASFVLVEDILMSGPIQPELRDGVGIDRFTGTAAERVKFDRAVLPRGTDLSFRLTVELEDRRLIGVGKNSTKETDDARADRIKWTKALIGHLLFVMQRGTLKFGAARTRGLGRVKLTELEPIREESFDQILNWLGFSPVQQSLTGTALKDEIAKLGPDAITASGTKTLEIEVSWRPVLPVMIKAGYDGVGVDMLPLTSSVTTDELALVLPGSSIKGALRSHAERIVRTLLPKSDHSLAKKFHDQIADVPLIQELFGAARKSEMPSQDEGERPAGLAALAIDDCYAKESMSVDQWRKVEAARDAASRENGGPDDDVEVSYFKRELWRYLREIDERKSQLESDDQYKEDTTRFKIQHHVAIDRWTGGAAPGALYSVLAPNKVDWEPMRLTLDFGRIKEELRHPVLMLLLLILRDVAENRLPFGFATNRGMGEVEVLEFCLRGTGLDAPLEGLNCVGDEPVRLAKGDVSRLPETLKRTLNEKWKEWLNKNRE
jgi:CRISPR/Cas system CSM-associated protein Csm3 (group 7 of RAMP superfamily)